jgi:hypothetical protein
MGTSATKGFSFKKATSSSTLLSKSWKLGLNTFKQLVRKKRDMVSIQFTGRSLFDFRMDLELIRFNKYKPGHL